METQEEAATILLNNSARRAGYVKKRGYRLRGLCKCCKPIWKDRYLVMAGGFLFRYSSEQAKSPKGAPIPLANATIFALEDGINENPLRTRSPDGNILLHCFIVSTIRNEYVFGTDDEEERDRWITDLTEEKQLAIKESLGHTKPGKGFKLAKKLGIKIFKEKIGKEMQETARYRETEMSLLGKVQF